MKNKVAMFLGLSVIAAAQPALADYKPGDPISFGHAHKAFDGDASGTAAIGSTAVATSTSGSTASYSSVVNAAVTKSATQKKQLNRSIASLSVAIPVHAPVATPVATPIATPVATSVPAHVTAPASGNSAVKISTQTPSEHPAAEAAASQPAVYSAQQSSKMADDGGARSHHFLRGAGHALASAAGSMLNPHNGWTNVAIPGVNAAYGYGYGLPAANIRTYASSVVSPGGSSDSEGQTGGNQLLPRALRRAVAAKGPEGSLNFSTPITAKGPFSKAGATPMHEAQQWDALLDYARGWSQAEPSNAFAWYYLGEASMHLNNFDAAVEGFRRATQYAPTEAMPWNSLAAAYCKREQFGWAGDTIIRGEAAAGPHCGATEWYVFGNARKALLDREGAIKDYQRALAMRPNFPEAINNMGVCQYELGDTADASVNYQRSAALGNELASQNQAGIVAEQEEARRLQEVQNDPDNVWNWSRKSLRNKMSEENSRRDINGNYRPRQY